MEAEGLFRVFVQRMKIFPGGFEQGIGPDDIGLDEFARTVDGAVHVGFRSQVHDMGRPEIGEDPVQGFFIADIGFFEPETGIAGDLRERFQVSRISQFVDHADFMRGLPDQMTDDRRTDESRAAGNDEFGHFLHSSE